MQETPQIAAKWRRFKRTGCQQTRTELIEHYLPARDRVCRLLRRRLPHWVEFDDIQGAASIGLLQAVDRFDPNTGLAFRTLADRRMIGAVGDWCRLVDPFTRGMRATGVLPELRNVDDYDRVLRQPVNVLRLAHNRMAAATVLQHTSKPNAEALWAHSHGMADTEMGARLNLCESAMTWRRKRGREEIAACCNREDFVWD